MVESGADVVRKFYGGVNRQDLGSVEGLIAEKCVYEDLVFPRPFIGRKVLHLLSASQLFLYVLLIFDCNIIILNLKINRKSSPN